MFLVGLDFSPELMRERRNTIVFISHVSILVPFLLFFFFNVTATTEIYTLSLHDALPISRGYTRRRVHWSISIPRTAICSRFSLRTPMRSEEHTSELQSRPHLVCRLL